MKNLFKKLPRSIRITLAFIVLLITIVWYVAEFVVWFGLVFMAIIFAGSGSNRRRSPFDFF